MRRIDGVLLRETSSDEPPDDGIRVFILNDHALVRRGLQDLLESEGFVVGMSRTRLNRIHHYPISKEN